MPTTRNWSYVGWRQESAGGATVVIREKIGAFYHDEPLPPRNDITNHSPDGFQWSYGGSGSAQLALAVCIHALDGDVTRAQRVYQDFKWATVAKITDDRWEFDREWVVSVIEQIELARQSRTVE